MDGECRDRWSRLERMERNESDIGNSKPVEREERNGNSGIELVAPTV